MFLYYIRHGDPIYDPDSLTPLGRRQAEALSRRLARYGLDEIYVSSSNRAMETCIPTCELLKKEPVVLDWTNEMYAWMQMTVTNEQGRRTWGFTDPETKAFFASEELAKMRFDWYRHPRFAGTKFGEGIERIRTETYAFLEKQGFFFDAERGGFTLTAPNEKRIALFAHEGFGLAFLSVVTNTPYPHFSTHFDMSHSDFSVIHFPEDEDPVIPVMLMHSNDSHLYHDGLPTKYHNHFDI